MSGIFFPKYDFYLDMNAMDNLLGDRKSTGLKYHSAIDRRYSQILPWKMQKKPFIDLILWLNLFVIHLYVLDGVALQIQYNVHIIYFNLHLFGISTLGTQVKATHWTVEPEGGNVVKYKKFWTTQYEHMYLIMFQEFCWNSLLPLGTVVCKFFSLFLKQKEWSSTKNGHTGKSCLWDR